MGEDYSMISIENTDKGLFLYQNECFNASKETTERIVANTPITETTVFLRITVTKGATCKFSYSMDGKTYTPFGSTFNAKPGRWIGAKIGYVCQRPKKSNDGGWADIDWFSIEK